MSWLGRAGARLLPAGRRDWAEAVWAEAHEVPAGWQRLAWRAGGVRLIAKEAQIARRIGVPLLFAAAAAAAAWVAWPKSRVSLSHGAANQGDVIITLVLLAGLPLVTRLFLGPPGSRAARWLRGGFYAAILIIMLAKPVAELFIGTVPRGGIDLRSFWMGRTGRAWTESRNDVIKAAVGMDRVAHTHHAGDDAAELAGIFAAVHRMPLG